MPVLHHWVRKERSSIVFETSSRHGRYKINTLPKAVLQQKSKVANKQSYVYNCSDSSFSQQQRDIANRFTPLELVDEEDQDME